MSSPYAVLGLSPSANKNEVKEAFRKLCLQYHPDKCSPEVRGVAEEKFRDIKAAYDQILKGQAGYNPPGPGNRPHPKYAKAWYHAHGVEFDGPMKVGGPFGGYATEWDFYRAMYRTSRNNPAVLIAIGIVAVPAVAGIVSMASGKNSFVERFKNEGIWVFNRHKWNVNGQTSDINPFMIRNTNQMEDSYLYKSEKFKHLRERMQPQPQAKAEAEAAPAPSS